VCLIFGFVDMYKTKLLMPSYDDVFISCIGNEIRLK